MSILERGASESEERDTRHREMREYRAVDNEKRTTTEFYRRFYEHHMVANPDWTCFSYSTPRVIVDPERPLPAITDFRLEASNDSIYVEKAESTFTCEGIRFACRWKYQGGGDRAYWDDGWWPDWFVVRRRWLILTKLIPVYSPASVAEATK